VHISTGPVSACSRTEVYVNLSEGVHPLHLGPEGSYCPGQDYGGPKYDCPSGFASPAKSTKESGEVDTL